MKPEELDRLIHRYFENDLSPEEEGLLWSVIRIDPASADRFVELSELESAMVEGQKAEEAAPPEVRSTRRESRRLTRVMSAPAQRRPVWPLFFAAGLMIAFLALLLKSAEQPQPAEVVRQTELPTPRPVEPTPTSPEPAPPKPVAPRPVETPIPAPPPVTPVPKPVEPPPVEPKPVEKPEPATPEKTVVAKTTVPDAKIVKVEGDVVDDAGAPAKVGPLEANRGLDVRKGSAVIALLDDTQIDLRPDTRLDRMVFAADQKRVVLSRGTASAVVAKQQPRMAMVFQTPHAEVTVLGTKLQIEIGKDTTRVDVHEGRVRCKRLSDGASTEIVAGRYAVAGKGPAPIAKPIPTVRNFQDGVAPTPDYRGTQDTWISSIDQTANSGKIEQLRLQRLSAQQTALIHWDLTGIPPGSKVVSAEMTFWVTGKLVGDCKIHALNLPFDESEATWRVAKGSLLWGAPGAQSDRDRGARPIALLAPEKPGFLTVAITDLNLVQNWINNPKENFGILIAGPDANVWGLESRETAVPERRPKLTITTISVK